MDAEVRLGTETWYHLHMHWSPGTRRVCVSNWSKFLGCKMLARDKNGACFFLRIAATVFKLIYDHAHHGFTTLPAPAPRKTWSLKTCYQCKPRLIPDIGTGPQLCDVWMLTLVCHNPLVEDDWPIKRGTRVILRLYPRGGFIGLWVYSCRPSSRQIGCCQRIPAVAYHPCGGLDQATGTSS